MAGILDSLIRRVIGAPVPGTGAPAATPTDHEPLTTTTVAALRAMLDEHDRGVFLRSALLADLLRRDADVFGALQQRLTLLGAHPVVFDPPDDSEAAKASAEELAAAWPSICPAGAAYDLWTDEAMLGFGLGQLVWTQPPEGGPLTQHLEPVHGSAVECDRTTGRWYVQTLDQGRLPITPGDGQWVLFAPRSWRAPHLWGAVRPSAEWYLSNAHVANDARRRSETTGQGIWKASFPTGERETANGRSFLASIRGMGRAAVIPTPKGATPDASYDVELVEAKSDAYKIFEWLKRAGGGAIRLALLGQDLTSQNNLVGTNASSETGADTVRAIVRAQARGWSETATQQVSAPRARYLGTPLTRVRVDADPEVDRKAEGEAAKAAADAVQAWEALGVSVDKVAHATAAGMKGAKAMASPQAPAGTGAAAFAVGDRVRVVGQAHGEGQTTGTIAELADSQAYGIVFDGMESMGVHRWYVGSELAAEGAAPAEKKHA